VSWPAGHRPWTFPQVQAQRELQRDPDLHDKGVVDEVAAETPAAVGRTKRKVGEAIERVGNSAGPTWRPEMTRSIRVLHLVDSPRDAEVIRHRLDVEGIPCDILVANSKDSFGPGMGLRALRPGSGNAEPWREHRWRRVEWFLNFHPPPEVLAAKGGSIRGVLLSTLLHAAWKAAGGLKNS
jgi:hypothetical protein